MRSPYTSSAYPQIQANRPAILLLPGEVKIQTTSTVSLIVGWVNTTLSCKDEPITRDLSGVKKNRLLFLVLSS